MEATFIVDGMLGSLARKLRILGYDTVFDKESNDAGLLLLSQETGRTLVTADVDLYLQANRQRIPTVLISSRSDRQRLYELFSNLGQRRLSTGAAPRCSLCNGELKDSGRESREGRKIQVCSACGKLYWKGSHWTKLELLFSDVDQLLRQDIKKNEKG
jgi:uncharacterized protein